MKALDKMSTFLRVNISYFESVEIRGTCKNLETGKIKKIAPYTERHEVKHFATFSPQSNTIEVNNNWKALSPLEKRFMEVMLGYLPAYQAYNKYCPINEQYPGPALRHSSLVELSEEDKQYIVLVR